MPCPLLARLTACQKPAKSAVLSVASPVSSSALIDRLRNDRFAGQPKSDWLSPLNAGGFRRLSYALGEIKPLILAASTAVLNGNSSDCACSVSPLARRISASC